MVLPEAANCEVCWCERGRRTDEYWVEPEETDDAMGLTLLWLRLSIGRLRGGADDGVPCDT